MVYLYMPPRYKSPSPYVSEPKSVTIPLEIRTHHNEPLTVQVLNSPKQWIRKQRTTTQTTDNKKCRLQVCKWYRRKRALKKLQKIHKLEKNIAIQDPSEYLERYEREKELMENVRQEKLQKLRSRSPPATAFTYDEKKAKKLAKKERKERERYEKEQRRLEKEYAKRLEKEHVKRLKREQADRLQKEHAEHLERVNNKRLEKENAKRLEKERAKRLERERADLLEKEHAKRLENKYAKRLEKEQAKRAKKLRKETKYYESSKYGKGENVAVESEHIKKPKKSKNAKMIYARPKATTRSVYAKREIQYREPISVRFTNCFYRFCCQLYCYMTFFLILGVVIFVIL